MPVQMSGTPLLVGRELALMAEVRFPRVVVWRVPNHFRALVAWRCLAVPSTPSPHDASLLLAWAMAPCHACLY